MGLGRRVFGVVGLFIVLSGFSSDMMFWSEPFGVNNDMDISMYDNAWD